LWWPWGLLALASLLVPWALYLSVPGGTVGNVLAPEVLWASLVPMLAGAAAALVLRRFGAGLPCLPLGDLVRVIDAAAGRCVAAGPAIARADALLLHWPVALLLLLATVLAFGMMLFGGYR
jgi:hypothetical protein